MSTCSACISTGGKAKASAFDLRRVIREFVLVFVGAGLARRTSWFSRGGLRVLSALLDQESKQRKMASSQKLLICLFVVLIIVSLFVDHSQAWLRRRRRRPAPRVCRLRCLNGGACYFRGSSDACSCRSPFYGSVCQFQHCTRTCLHGGQCVLNGYNEECRCPWTHYGANCQYRRCTLSCRNGGRCVVNGNTISCFCPSSHYGRLCHIKRCILSCRNGGVCRKLGNDIQYCQCPRGYFGQHCQYKPCNRHCYNGGKCYFVDQHWTRTACRCTTGYTGSYCQYHTPKKSLLLSTRKAIYSINLPPYKGHRLLASGLTNAIAVDFYAKNRMYFWTDVSSGTITRSDYIGSNKRAIASTNVKVPDGLAVDWMAGNLYWSDTGTDTISVSRLDGTHRKTIINFYLDEPRALALHPAKGVFFFTDWGKHARIERANLDGRHRRFLYSDTTQTKLKWPNGLTIDFQNNMLYWADAGVDKIGRMDFNGGSRQLVFTSKINHPFDITLDGKMLYWTDWTSKFVERGTTSGIRLKEFINIGSGGVAGVKVVDTRKQSGSNVCSRNNGGCSHLCLAFPVNYRGRLRLGHYCDCPDKSHSCRRSLHYPR